MRRYSSHTRPLWKTARDAIVFLLVLAAVTAALDYFQVLDIGRGNARAKDGDSLMLGETEIRLHGIDAPEYNQRCGSPSGDYACGREALAALRGLLRGRTISCSMVTRDRYRRIVALCRDGELDVNREMVRLGWAVAFVRHTTFYLPEQQEAKAARRGIWQGSFEMPEEYRSRHRTATSDVGGGAEDD